jgi:hypothetical protein
MESATNIKQVIGFSEHASPARTDGKIIAAKPPGVLIRLPLFASGPRDFSSAASCRHASCSAKSSFCFGLVFLRSGLLGEQKFSHRGSERAVWLVFRRHAIADKTG